MKAFRFTLAQVLRFREWTEAEAKKKLAAEQSVRLALETEIQALEGGMQELWKVEAGVPVDCNSRMQRLEYSRHLGYVIEDKRAESEAQKLKVEQASTVLMRAAQERKSLEKLRERQKQRHYKDQGRRTAAQLDEVSANFVQRAAESSDENP